MIDKKIINVVRRFCGDNGMSEEDVITDIKQVIMGEITASEIDEMISQYSISSSSLLNLSSYIHKQIKQILGMK